MSIRADRALRVSVVAMLMIFTLSSCAYSWGLGPRRLPEGHTRLAIPVFKNRTHEAGAEVAFTNSMIREFQRSRIGQIVDKREAEVVLEGSIDEIVSTSVDQLKVDQPGGLIPQGTILNTVYRVTVYTSLQLKRVSDGRIIWSDSFSGERSYLAPKLGLEGLNSANALYNHSARQELIAAMAVDVMAEAHGRLTENF